MVMVSPYAETPDISDVTKAISMHQKTIQV